MDLSGIWVKVLVPCSISQPDEQTIHSCFNSCLSMQSHSAASSNLGFTNTSVGIVPGSYSSESAAGGKPVPCVQADVHMNLLCKYVEDEKTTLTQVLCALKSALCSTLDLPKNQLTGLLVQMTYYCSKNGPGYKVYYFNDIKENCHPESKEDSIDDTEDKFGTLQEQLKEFKSRL